MNHFTAQQACMNYYWSEWKIESDVVNFNATMSQLKRESLLGYETTINAVPSVILKLQRDLIKLGYTVEQTAADELYVSWYPSRVF